jgi:hypothetical protein
VGVRESTLGSKRIDQQAKDDVVTSIVVDRSRMLHSSEGHGNKAVPNQRPEMPNTAGSSSSHPIQA